MGLVLNLKDKFIFELYTQNINKINGDDRQRANHKSYHCLNNYFDRLLTIKSIKKWTKQHFQENWVQ